ncbi:MULTISPECIES: hypothetical protein [unclassified Crossiella]|uniref:hypothetical protein n=1 Tax=unclassified Crossiella TaxID=2620835 RepID=UPI001FFE4C0D|nr:MULTISPECIES: hypothetical protein [unclassified Crossiella]MCK2240007.1 hypothetical protein [Crossiella sp. S99.2]MCK2252715.1 hypothetical protein [Crossiella sp. S99.1]
MNEVHNVISGNVTGDGVQAGEIHGGVNFPLRRKVTLDGGGAENPSAAGILAELSAHLEDRLVTLEPLLPHSAGALKEVTAALAIINRPQ